MEAGIESDEWKLMEAKGRLFRYASMNKLPPPVLEVVEQRGPSNKPHFRIMCSFNGLVGYGEGGSKKEAEARACLEVLKQL